MSWAPNDDGRTYRCTACGAGAFVPGVDSCDCGGDADTHDPETGRAARPQLSAGPSQSQGSGAAGNSNTGGMVDGAPDAQLVRREATKLYMDLRKLAKAQRKTDDRAELARLSATARTLEVARKALSSIYEQARDREMLDVVERYERMVRELKEQPRSRRAVYGLGDDDDEGVVGGGH